MKKLLLAASILFASLSTSQAASFDCGKAKTADEFAICSSALLSTTDEIVSLAFYQVKAWNRDGALAVARQHIRERRLCGFDMACVYASQIRAGYRYQLLGATVIAALAR